MSCNIIQEMTARNVSDHMCQRPWRDKTYKVTIVAAVTGGSAALAVVLRMIDALIEGHFGWHDACALGAGIWASPMNVAQFLIGLAGFGRDAWTVPFENLVVVQKVRCQVQCWKA
jgi:hypothetical protein